MYAYRTFVAAVLLAASLPAAAEARSWVLETEAGPVRAETVADGLNHPWAMVFLPDGRALVTERAGDLRILRTDGTMSGPLPGVPAVRARGQGGLLDVALDPAFAENRLVYLSFAESGDGGAGTALGRGRLVDDRIDGFQVIFRQRPKVSGNGHYGGRIAFAPDGTLFLTMGDRQKLDPAQDMSDHMGTIVRLNPDGSVPADNPFVGQAGALPEIWSYGHRNVEAAAIHPETGLLWEAEMGPRGGDELNQPERGRNHGWPLVSWGTHYSGRDIPDPPTRPEFADAKTYWVPSISPSGMAIYTGEMFPAWRGNVLLGALSGRALVRIVLDGNEVAGQERIATGTRIREVEQGPDGSIFLLTDSRNGEIWRLRPDG